MCYHGWVVWACACLVGVLGAAEPDPAALLRQLSDPDVKVREAAAIDLAKQDYVPTAEVNLLAQAAKDPSPVVRRYAIVALMKMLEPILYAMGQWQTEADPKARQAMQAAQLKFAEFVTWGPKGGTTAAISPVACNESAAVSACKSYAEAQDIYRRTDWNADGILEYAQSIKGDFSLFETKKGAADLQLLEQGMAAAEGEPGGKASHSGYRFVVLKAQGADVPGGQKSYVRESHMTLGYALVAYPAEYGVTGRSTFLINNTGTVYQKDLGAETHAIVGKMTEYNPDKSWQVAE